MSPARSASPTRQPSAFLISPRSGGWWSRKFRAASALLRALAIGSVISRASEAASAPIMFTTSCLGASFHRATEPKTGILIIAMASFFGDHGGARSLSDDASIPTNGRPLLDGFDPAGRFLLFVWRGNAVQRPAGPAAEPLH